MPKPSIKYIKHEHLGLHILHNAPIIVKIILVINKFLFPLSIKDKVSSDLIKKGQRRRKEASRCLFSYRIL